MSDEESTPKKKRSRFAVSIPTVVAETRDAIAGMRPWQRFLTSGILTGLLAIYIPQVTGAGVIAITGAVVVVAVIVTYLTGTLRLIFTWLAPASLMFFVYPFAALPVTLAAFYLTLNRVLREARQTPED